MIPFRNMKLHVACFPVIAGVFNTSPSCCSSQDSGSRNQGAQGPCLTEGHRPKDTGQDYGDCRDWPSPKTRKIPAKRKIPSRIVTWSSMGYRTCYSPRTLQRRDHNFGRAEEARVSSYKEPENRFEIPGGIRTTDSPRHSH